MLMNLGSSWGWCAEAPTLGKAALARAFKPTVSIGAVRGLGGRGCQGILFFKERGNCRRLETAISWVLNTKRKSTKLALIKV